MVTVFSHFAFTHFFKSILLMITYISINIHPYCSIYGLFKKYYFVAILSIPKHNRKWYFECVPEAPFVIERLILLLSVLIHLYQR